MQPTDNFRIDSHKLIFHPHRVSEWLDGKTVFPIYMEVSPSGTCNHRCTFCAKDYLGYHPRFPDTEILLKRLTEFGSLGVRSILYSGEGEPLLNRDIAQIVQHTKAAGIDVAVATNGVFLTPEISEQLLPVMSWLKISINAGSPSSYAAIHGTMPADFDRVLGNIATAAGIIKERGLACTLGTQMLLLPENAHEAESLAARVKAAGVNYLVIKPYSQHYKSHTRKYADIDYAPYLALADKLERFNDSSFNVIFRTNTIMKTKRAERGYKRCLALPFWSYIDSAGDVWACNSHLGDDRFIYGNILDDSFFDIWNGERRRRSLDFVAAAMDVETCRMNCRMDEINYYLWELTHSSEHANFI